MSTITKFEMHHERDPGDVIREEVGDISNVEVMHNLVLLSIYKRPEKTKGGIILTDRTKSEEVYQGTVGLVLKVGPGAFKDDGINKFHGQSVSPGDWVCVRNSDCQRVAINGVHCRLIEDSLIKLKIGHPDQAF
jgi:co-chaperonin GroES (HSP10)